MPILRRIAVFPIKALTGVTVSEVALTGGGALEYDREYALFDSSDGYVNGKRHKDIHRVAAQFDLSNGSVDLRVDGEPDWSTFALLEEQPEIAAFLGERLGLDLVLRRNASSGYPDDTDAWGPTIISTATLQEVAKWFPGLDINSVRRRQFGDRWCAAVLGGPSVWTGRIHRILRHRERALRRCESLQTLCCSDTRSRHWRELPEVCEDPS